MKKSLLRNVLLIGLGLSVFCHSKSYTIHIWTSGGEFPVHPYVPGKNKAVAQTGNAAASEKGYAYAVFSELLDAKTNAFRLANSTAGKAFFGLKSHIWLT